MLKRKWINLGKKDNIFMKALLAIIILAIIISQCSCKSTKNLDKSKEVIVVTEKINVDSIVKQKVDSVVKHYQEVMKSLDADIVFFADTVFVPGKERVVNTIKYVPGKGIDVSGNIKQFKLKQEELIKLIDEITIEKENEINLRVHAENVLKAELERKELYKKTKVLNWWVFLLIGYAACFVVDRRRWFMSLFKK